ncbi:MAG: class I SAM-dependent methyltransferase, partial [Halobacteriota archaeon]
MHSNGACCLDCFYRQSSAIVCGNNLITDYLETFVRWAAALIFIRYGEPGDLIRGQKRVQCARAERVRSEGMHSNIIKCAFCGTSTAERPAAESARVRCDIREFGAETFTVWRCAKCGSLHALEPIDADRYYRDYPAKREPYNFIMRVQLRKRLGILERTGLHRGDTLLDYGCGSGHFVRYAREHGIRAEGYDPYSEKFGDASVLDRCYDFVTAQDVLEHVDDPRALVDDLKGYAAPSGRVTIGTPNADAIDLNRPLDQVG